MRKARSVRRSARIRDVRPPMRGGVNAVPIILPDGDWATLRDWSRFRFDDDGPAALDRGDFFADGGVVLGPDEPFSAGKRIWAYRPVTDEPEEPIILDVIAENDRILVVDKPHGMATIPRGSHVARTVTVAARRQFGTDNLVPAHRLDAETAGLVLLTKSPEYRGAYQKLFEHRKVGKKYLAVAPYVSGFDDWKRVELLMERVGETFHSSVLTGAPNAITDVRMLRTLPCLPSASGRSGRSDPSESLRLPSASGQSRSSDPSESLPLCERPELTEPSAPLALWELRPETGKTHQLRVTLNHIGAPIVGDPLYPRLFSLEEVASRPFPLQLLASELSFVDPFENAERIFRSRRQLAAAQ